MFIDEITQVAVREGSWHTRDTYLKPQTCVDQVEFEVFA